MHCYILKIMNIGIRTYDTLCEITIETDNTKIVEGLSYFDRTKETSVADENIAEDLITAYFDINRFNKKTDIDSVKEIFAAFLNNTEQAQFLLEMNE